MVQVVFWMVYQPISGFVLELGLIEKPFIEGGVQRGDLATCYRNKKCRSLKLPVLRSNLVIPDVIVSITPHIVMVKCYYNGWLRD